MNRLLTEFEAAAGVRLDENPKNPVRWYYFLKKLCGITPDETDMLRNLSLEEWEEFDAKAISYEQLEVARIWIFCGEQYSPVRMGKLTIGDFFPGKELLEKAGYDILGRIDNAYRNGRRDGAAAEREVVADKIHRQYAADLSRLQLIEALRPYSDIEIERYRLSDLRKSLEVKLEDFNEREQELQRRVLQMERYKHAMKLTNKEIEEELEKHHHEKRRKRAKEERTQENRSDERNSAGD